MKKFMKVCAILALILIVSGVAMATISGAILGPIAFSQLRSYLQGLDMEAYYNLEDHMSFDSYYTVFQGDTEQSFSAEEVQSLNVNAGACQLVIDQSPDDKFHVEVQQAGKYQGYVNGKKLYIKAAGKTRLGGGNDVCRIRLCVPEAFIFEEIELSLGAGQITGKTDLQVQNMEIELGAGEIDLSALTAGELEAEVGMGALTVKGDIRQKAKIECAMGSIQMTLAGSKSDYNYQVETAAGDVNIGGQSFAGVAGEWNMSNDSTRDVSVECAMGSIIISFLE